MDSKERLLTAIQNKKPDMVPVSPDLSQMIPCRLAAKPFWDIYLYDDPPLWKVYIDTASHDVGFILSTGDQCGRDTPEKII